MEIQHIVLTLPVFKSMKLIFWEEEIYVKANQTVGAQNEAQCF